MYRINNTTPYKIRLTNYDKTKSVILLQEDVMICDALEMNNKLYFYADVIFNNNVIPLGLFIIPYHSTYNIAIEVKMQNGQQYVYVIDLQNNNTNNVIRPSEY